MSHRVLLTGANGFLGSHILSQFLSHHHSVRVIVRSQAKADQVRKDFPSYDQKSLDFGIVPDITAPGAFDEVLKFDPPFDIVIHTASPFMCSAVSDNLKDFLEPAVKGTEEIMKSTKAHAPGVKRVLCCCAAVLDFAAGDDRKVFTNADWNPTGWEDAVGGDNGTGYKGSKKFAEKTAWDFIEREKPNFDLVTLCPPMIYGPLQHTITKTVDLNQSNSRIYDLFVNSSKDAKVPPNALYLYVDVRDIAAAHIQAATIPEASNKRFVISKGQISSQQISEILRKNIPELEKRTPVGKPGNKGLPSNAYNADGSEAEKILDIKFRSAEKTFVDLGKQLLAIEAQQQA